MKICIPFTHLRSETYLACAANEPRNVGIYPIEDHQWGYAEYWINRWREGATFINVEHDVVPKYEALVEMWNCPEPYCKLDYAYPYAGCPIHVSPIGCAKFSDSFIATHQGIFVSHLHWHDPQHIIISASLNQAHVHQPPALHLHVSHDWPLDAKRKYQTPE